MTVMKDTNRYRVQIIKPQAGTNLIMNPNPYRTTTGYTHYNGVMILDDTHTRRGPQCLKITPNTGVASGVYYSDLPVVTGKKYTFSVDVKGVAEQAMRIYIATSAGAAKETKAFTATGNWQRIEVTFTADETKTDYRVYVTRDAVASTELFWVDGFQFEQSDKATTFIMGYEKGLGFIADKREYWWDELPYQSTSKRSEYTRHGGALVDISEYAEIKAIYGLGMGVFEQITTPVVTGGELYQKHIRKARPFSIDLIYTGKDIADLQKKRQALLDVLRPDATPYDQPMVLRIQVIDDNNDEAGDPVDIVCTFETSHTDTPNYATSQKDRLLFRALDGHLLGAFKNGKTLDYKVEFQGDHLIKRDSQGRWVDSNDNNWMAGVSGSMGTISVIKEAPNGDIYIGGNFPNVSNNGVVVAGTRCIARYSKANQQWEAVGSVDLQSAESIQCMEFDAAGNLYVGGLFLNLAGIANADYFAKYNLATSTWSGFGGLGLTVNAISISSDGVIYIGGWFSSASGNADCKHVAFWNGSAWSPLATGLNDIVFDIKHHPNGDLLISGMFLDADGAKGDYVCYWRDGAFHAFEDLGAVPIDNLVAAIDIMPDGTIVIGGHFINAGGESGADLIAKWNGTNWARFGDAQLLRTDNGGFMSYLYCARNGDVYACGTEFTVNGSSPINRLLIYKNGYYQVPEFYESSGTASFASFLLARDDSLYIGGSFTGIITASNPGEIEYKLSTSSGSANAYPEITIVGPGKLEAVTNHSTGRTIRFNNLTLLDGEELWIHFDPVNLKLQSSWKDRGSVWRYLNAGSDIGDWYMKPGVNSIGVFISSGYDMVKTTAYVQWQPKFWSLDGAVYE